MVMVSYDLDFDVIKQNEQQKRLNFSISNEKILQIYV